VITFLAATRSGVLALGVLTILLVVAMLWLALRPPRPPRRVDCEGACGRSVDGEPSWRKIGAERRYVRNTKYLCPTCGAEEAHITQVAPGIGEG